MELSGVIAIMVDPEVLITRITARRTCATCGTIVNLALNPLENLHKCPTCGGELVEREDDNETVVRNRIEQYHEQTEPLLAYYQSRNLLFPVEGLGTVYEVRARVSTVLEQINGGPVACQNEERQEIL
jgi:adenylate kinase